MDRQELIDKILGANLDALGKVRQLVHLGMDEEDADDLVENYELGRGQSIPVYYERLQFEEYE